MSKRLELRPNKWH